MSADDRQLNEVLLRSMANGGDGYLFFFEKKKNNSFITSIYCSGNGGRENGPLDRRRDALVPVGLKNVGNTWYIVFFFFFSLFFFPQKTTKRILKTVI